jgi:hypothetical protein
MNFYLSDRQCDLVALTGCKRHDFERLVSSMSPIPKGTIDPS